MKAIRLKCVDCMAGQKCEIRACPAIKCPLWKFRLGIHPFTQKNLKNPFLEPSNFVGKEELSASEVIEKVGDISEV